MTKYKLLKDIPNAKAGEIFELKENGSLLFQGSDKSAGVFYKKEEVVAFDLLNPDKGWFEKIEEKRYGGRVPKEGDKYWYIFANGSTADDFWNGAEWDTDRFESGSAFWTREEAEKELKRRKAYVILKEDTKGFKPDWVESANQMKYYVFYSYDGLRELRVSFAFLNKEASLYSKTREDAKASIENHRQQWLDYLGIEEEVESNATLGI